MLKRPVPLHAGSAEFGVSSRRDVAEPAVWLDGVVIDPPGFDLSPSVSEALEPVLVDTLVAVCTENLVRFEKSTSLIE